MKDYNKVIVIILAVGFFLFLGLFGGTIGYGNFGCGIMSFGGPGWIFSLLFMTLIIVALILFIIWLIQQIEQNKK